MKLSSTVLVCVLLACGVFGQEKPTKEQRKEAERARKQAEQQERAAYEARIRTPPVEILPITANRAGELLLALMPGEGYTFAGYQPGASIFGAETAQIALFTCGLSTGEIFRYGGNAVKFMAFAVSDQGGKAQVVGNAGVMRGTYTGPYYTSLLHDLDFRSRLHATLGRLREAAGKLDEIQVKQEGEQLAIYRKLAIGQSFAEIEKVLGKGKLIEETETATTRTAEYEWKATAWRIVLTFENDKLARKSQAGLQ
jgi:hypothetical protein